MHNSPALDSLKHQQLRSLCARHGLKSTGKVGILDYYYCFVVAEHPCRCETKQKDHLIKRLKALRDRPLQDGAQDIPTSEDATTPLDGSFDILDDEEAEEAQQFGSLPGSFESDRNTAASFAMHSRVSTDEFGALSAGMFLQPCFYHL